MAPRSVRWEWLACALALIGCDADPPREAPRPTPLATETSEAPDATPAPKLVAPVREGGALVRAATDDALFIADEDHAVVRRVPLPIDVNTPPQEIAMPGQPAQVLALGDRVLVTIRSAGGFAPGASSAPKADRPNTLASATGPGLLLVMRPDDREGLVEIARVELPQDAWGVAVSEDERTAVVTSAWTHKVSVVDLESTKVRGVLNVAREPRGVVILPNGKTAYVTHLVGADVTRIDDLDGEPNARAIPLPASPLRTAIGKKNDASLAYAAVLSPDGSRLFVARHAIGAVGPQVWFGASAVDVLSTKDDAPLAPFHVEGPRVVAGELQNLLFDLSSGGTAPRTAPTSFAQPRAVLYRGRDQRLLVASEGTGAVVELDARSIDPALHVTDSRVYEGCKAPTGIALSKDEMTAWVYCRASNTIVVDSFGWKGPRPYVEIAKDLLSEQAKRGRELFYDATDAVVSGGLACAGCHPEGRDDGHVWHETDAVDGHPTFVGAEQNVPTLDRAYRGYPRQTPMLAGRVIAEGPYGWHAESPNITARLRAGFDLHRWNEHWPMLPNETYAKAMAIRAFLREGLVPPPRRSEPLSEAELRGREIFNSRTTGCAGCHVPASDFSDREAYGVFGSFPTLPGFADEEEKRFKTPSLRFVGGTPPYAHDGRFPTLRALIDRNDDHMGRTNQLSSIDRDALVAYLETL